MKKWASFSKSFSELEEARSRLKITRDPKNEKEKAILLTMDRLDEHQALTKTYNRIKRKAFNALKTEDPAKGNFLELLIELVRSVDILQEVAVSYLDVYNEDESVPMDVRMGYKEMPTYKEYREYMTGQLTPLMVYEKQAKLLCGQINAFLAKIKKIDKQDII